MRRANRKDLAHGDVVDGLRFHGVSVYDMPSPGDILTYGPIGHGATVYDNPSGTHRLADSGPRSIFIPMEIKTPTAQRQGVKATLTKSQKKRSLSAAPIPIVHSLREALALYGRTL